MHIFHSYHLFFYIKFSQRYQLCSVMHISGICICSGYIYYSTHFHFIYISMHVWVIPSAPLSYAEVFLSLALVVHIVWSVRANTERRFSKMCILRLCLHVYDVNVSASVLSLINLFSDWRLDMHKNKNGLWFIRYLKINQMKLNCS